MHARVTRAPRSLTELYRALTIPLCIGKLIIYPREQHSNAVDSALAVQFPDLYERRKFLAAGRALAALSAVPKAKADPSRINRGKVARERSADHSPATGS
jgi:hypothetical protein